jgi:hypothetical protein
MEGLERVFFWVHSLALLLKESARALSDPFSLLGRGFLTLSMLFGLLIVGEPLGFWVIHPKTTAWVLADPTRADMEILLKRLSVLNQEGDKGAKPIQTPLKQYPKAAGWLVPFAKALSIKERKVIEETLTKGLEGLQVLWQDPTPLMAFEGHKAARRFIIVASTGLASLGFVYALFLYQAIERGLALWRLWFWHGLALKDFKILAGFFVLLQGLFDTLLWGSITTLAIVRFHLGPSKDFQVIAWAWMGFIAVLSSLLWVKRLLRNLNENACTA